MSTPDAIDHALRLLEARNVDHPEFLDKAAELRARCEIAPSGTVILLTGISGLGTNRIARYVRAEIYKQTSPYNPYLICEVDAKPPTEGRFNYRRFYIDGLKALNEPVLGQRKRAKETDSGRTEYKEQANFRGPEEYRADFEDALGKRGTRILILTDAHFLLRTLKPNEYHYAFSVFRKLVNGRAGGPQVAILSGTPVIRDLLGSEDNPELTNSGIDQAAVLIDVKVPDPSTKSGKENAVAMLKGFEEILGAAAEKMLLTSEVALKKLEARTLFVPGVIKQALVGALQAAKKKASATISWNDVYVHLPLKRQLQRLRADIEAARIRCLDGVPEPAPQEKAADDERKESKEKTSRRVGERNAASDPVGVS
jgi:hypothetical protein